VKKEKVILFDMEDKEDKEDDKLLGKE